MKAIILARVSSKEQEDGQSIPAQVRRLTEYVDKHQLHVIKVFQITESSTKESRKEFEKIIELISKSKECIALIADTVDRVQRGFKESILIEKLLREGKMELHFLRDRLLDKNSNSTDIMRWDMSVMFAKSYVLQLSDKGKYVYYSCTNAKGNCHRDYINENVFLKEIAQYFDDISLSEELIQQITLYLKDIYKAEGKFYREQKARLRKEQDQIQQRISKMYDDRYDGKIDEVFFEKKLKEYKDREFAILQEMESHAKGDESFHVTANMVLSLARRARAIFESSEVEEKRQLLNFVFQNLELRDKKLSVEYREPFKMIKDTSFLGKCPGMCPG